MKTCPTCKRELPLTEFSPNRGRPRGECKGCRNLSGRILPKDHPIKAHRRAVARAWSDAHPEQAAATRARSVANRRARIAIDPVPIRTRARRQKLHKYGLTFDSWDALLHAQGGVCAICKRTEPDGRGGNWHTDHDPVRGFHAVRGLLCFSCNSALGKFGDSIAGVQRALDYLIRHEQRVTATETP